MPEPGRVLHVLRADHAGHVGGDLVQLGATVEALRDLGVDAIAATLADAPDDVGVVHLYNLQRPASLLRDVRTARRRWPSAAIALSPVWWPMELATMAKSGQRQVLAKAVKTGLKSAAWWPYLRRLLGRVDLVLPNSEAEVRALRRSFRLAARPPDDRRWVVVPNGIDLDRWPVRRADTERRGAVLERLGLDPGAPLVIACVARIEPVKNQRSLVLALDHLPDAVLVLVGPAGTDRYLAAVEKAATAEGRRGRVAFAGRLDAASIAEVLSATDVHALVSYRETPGLASLEAAATGCAVVVTADGSAPEYFGDAAHVTDPFDPVAVATSIAAAASDSRQLVARRRVERYSWRVAGEVLAGAYERVTRS